MASMNYISIDNKSTLNTKNSINEAYFPNKSSTLKILH